jgi:hypothetical protein
VTDYPFEQQIVVDPDNPENVVRDGEVWLYDPADVDGAAPLALTDPSGLPITQPLHSNPVGLLPAFVAPVPQVLWKSGTYENYFNSFSGMRDEAVAAAAAAAAAADSAAVSAAAATEAEQYAQGPTDAQVDDAVRRAVRPSGLALADDGTPYLLDGANEVQIYLADDGNYYFR